MRRAVAVGVVQLLSRVVLRMMGVRRRSLGHRPAPGTLLLANHLSWLDIVVLIAEHRLAFVAKNEVRAWPIVGPCAEAIGVVFIDRARRRDLLRAIPALERRLRDGCTVVLFPEGTTTDGRELRPFKSALVEAAVRAGAPIQPVALRAFAEGDPHPLCWIDDETLMNNLPRVRRTRGALFEMHWLPPIAGHGTRKPCTREARAAIVSALDGPALRTGRAADMVAHRGWRTARGASLAALRGLAGFLIALVVVTGLLYMQAPQYDFAPSAPFRGVYWYNPYDAGTGAGAIWWRANLHSHARAWGGATAGRQDAEAVVRRYRELGTQVVGLSDYHAAPESRPAGTIPVYEHGWNIAKAHRLAIGASSVLWFDFPFWGSVNEEQYAIDQLHAHAELIAIAHPGLRDGHGTSSLARLANYELLEVMNHFLPPADSAWDAVLSAGRPVWLLAGDDSHDVTSTGETGTNFTRVLAVDTSARAVLTALRAGRAYGVRSYDHRGTLHLRDLQMRGDTLVVHVQGTLRSLRVIGQGGTVRARWRAAATTRDTVVALRTVAEPGDGYLRVVAEGEGEWLYTNPVVRWNGHALPVSLATVNGSRTVLRQTAWRLAYAWIALWWLAQLPLRWPWRRPNRNPVVPA